MPVEFIQVDTRDELDSIQILGISCTSQDYAVAIEKAREAKSLRPSLVTVLGGHHISHLPETLDECFDIGVVGEGEQTFTELLDALHHDQLIIRPETLKHIKGLVFRDGNQLFITEKRPLIEPLDSIPHPLRSHNETPYLFTSRGCPYKCAFCSSSAFWDKTRFFSAEYVVEEIEQIVKMFPDTRHMAVWDDVFAANKIRFHRIIDMLEQKGLTERLQFSFTCRANLINDELCSVLKRFRVPCTAFGAESGSNRILKLMNKGSTVEINQKALDCLYRHGIPAAAAFVVGWPTETEDEVRQTFEFILKNLYEGKLEIGTPVNILMPIPGTQVWNDAVKTGLLDPRNFDWRRLAVFAAFGDSNAGSLDKWIEHRRANNSLYLAEDTLPQELLYEIMIEYQMLFDSYRNLKKSLNGHEQKAPAVEITAAAIIDDKTVEETYYSHQRPEILNEVPKEAMTILDIGCGAGTLGRGLIAENASRSVIGIELNSDACSEAAKSLEMVYCANVEEFAPPFRQYQFDCIICADILEHLVDPWAVICRYLHFLKNGGTFIASLPNIRNIEVISKLLHDGEWEYQDEGILDRTHLRFFTRSQFLKYIKETDLICNRITYMGSETRNFDVKDTSLTFQNITIDHISPDEAVELFATQIIFTCVKQSGCILQPQIETKCLFDMHPRNHYIDGICYGEGFYDEFENSRWIASIGKLYVASRLLTQRLVLSFDISCYKLRLLHTLPLTMSLYLNDIPFENHVFRKDDEKKSIEIMLYPAQNDACIRIEASTCFAPSDNEQSPDNRLLSLLFTNLKIKALD